MTDRPTQGLPLLGIDDYGDFQLASVEGSTQAYFMRFVAEDRQRIDELRMAIESLTKAILANRH